MGKENLALMISGGGTTMEQMILACQRGEVAMNVACVIASTIEAGGIKKAQKLGVPTVVVNPDTFRKDGKVDQDHFGGNLLGALRAFDATVVTQNGWMPLTPENVIDAYPNRMFNQHPGPVPEFGGKGMFGMRVHAARLEFFRMVNGRDPWTIATAQRVHRNFDQGEVVREGYVPIFENDTPETLQQRVLPVEHSTQIALLKDISYGRAGLHLPPRHDQLIRPGEEHLFEEAKRRAIAQYPKG